MTEENVFHSVYAGPTYEMRSHNLDDRGIEIAPGYRGLITVTHEDGTGATILLDREVMREWVRIMEEWEKEAQ